MEKDTREKQRISSKKARIMRNFQKRSNCFDQENLINEMFKFLPTKSSDLYLHSFSVNLGKQSVDEDIEDSASLELDYGDVTYEFSFSSDYEKQLLSLNVAVIESENTSYYGLEKKFKYCLIYDIADIFKGLILSVVASRRFDSSLTPYVSRLFEMFILKIGGEEFEAALKYKYNLYSPFDGVKG